MAFDWLNQLIELPLWSLVLLLFLIPLDARTLVVGLLGFIVHNLPIEKPPDSRND